MTTDAAQIEAFANDPVSFYLKARRQARGDDFPFPQFEPILKHLIEDLRARGASKVCDRASELLRSGAPYKATHRFIMTEYLPFLDTLSARVHPELVANSFHRDNSERLLEISLGLAPDLLVFYTFQSLNFDFFLRTRPVPMPILGLTLLGLNPGEAAPHADRFNMKNSEFTWHDWGHLQNVAVRDLSYIEQSGKALERVVSE